LGIGTIRQSARFFNPNELETSIPSGVFPEPGKTIKTVEAMRVWLIHSAKPDLSQEVLGV
jgi:hypothetical protein